MSFERIMLAHREFLVRIENLEGQLEHKTEECMQLKARLTQRHSFIHRCLHVIKAYRTGKYIKT